MPAYFNLLESMTLPEDNINYYVVLVCYVYIPGNGHQAGEGVEVVGVPHGDREEALDDSSRLKFKWKKCFSHAACRTRSTNFSKASR